MTPRLYRTTRPLALAVNRRLTVLGLSAIGSPTTALLIGLYVTGLILLDAHPTQTRVICFLPGRCHDALNRLLRLMPFSTRALMAVPLAWAKRHGPGYLCLDDVVVEKAFARKLSWAGWTHSFAQKRKVYGLHLVVLLWCSHDGRWRIPVAFRLWRPKRSVGRRDYRTKLQPAEQVLKEAPAAGLRGDYLIFDTRYTAGWFTKMLARLGLTWVGTLGPRTHVVWRGEKLAVRDLAPRLRLTWRPQLGLRAVALRVYAPTFGSLRLVVTRNRHGNCEYLVSNDLRADVTTLVVRMRSRWAVETIFRDAKQFAGLGTCQCRVDPAMVRHVALVLLTFTALQMLRRHPMETVGRVKERWQREVAGDGEHPPAPLAACPAHLRPNAYALSKVLQAERPILLRAERAETGTR